MDNKLTPEIIVSLLTLLPNGKTIIPIELVIDKMGTSTILSIRIKLNIDNRV